jgi:hypothetical protein
VPLLVSLTGKRAIYLALELDRSWTETFSHRLDAGRIEKSLSIENVLFLEFYLGFDVA